MLLLVRSTFFAIIFQLRKIVKNAKHHHNPLVETHRNICMSFSKCQFENSIWWVAQVHRPCCISVDAKPQCRDKTSTMTSRPPPYHFSLRSYWRKSIRDMRWHVWWRHIHCTGVTGKHLRLIHCRILFVSSRVARFVMDVGNQVEYWQQRTFTLTESWHDLENKVIAHQPKAMETCRLQTLCRRVEK